MKAFLVEHDRRTRRTELITFDDVAEAMAVYGEREAEREAHIEVVLLFAESEGDLRNTHSRYFYGLTELVRRGWESDPYPAVDAAAG